MKQVIFIFFLLLLAAVQPARGQQQQDCYDKVRLKDGSLFKGTVTHYTPGDSLTIQTFSGLTLHFDANKVRRVIQVCPELDEGKNQRKDAYVFKEKGLYQSARLGFLPGTDSEGNATFGGTLQLSAGYSWHRMLAAGIGIGADYFSAYLEDFNTYPVFGECRGFFKPKKSSGFYNFGIGWALAQKANNEAWQNNRNRGGLMFQGQLGYRFGDHFLCYLGYRMQNKQVQYNWGATEVTDFIRQRRIEVGIGLTL